MYIKMIAELKKREAETGERIYVERDWRKKFFQIFKLCFFLILDKGFFILFYFCIKGNILVFLSCHFKEIIITYPLFF